jgi:hypothetical protein
MATYSREKRRSFSDGQRKGCRLRRERREREKVAGREKEREKKKEEAVWFWRETANGFSRGFNSKFRLVI